jgi:hypothetical protein
LNRNYKVGIIAAGAAISLAVAAVLASSQGTAMSGGPREIAINFSVYPENYANAEPIIVERGESKSIPLKVEAPNDAEATLQLRLETTEPAQLDAELSQTTVVLSKSDLADGKVTELGSGRGTRDAGMLTLNPPTSLQPGQYTLMLEATQQVSGEMHSGLGSGTIIYVTVR